MSDNWKKFLTQQGAVYDDDGVRHFGNPAAELRAAQDGNVLVDLSHLALVRVSGPDAKAFLDAQLTNDLDSVDSNRSRIAAWCSAKGRVLVVVRVLRQADSYLLQFPAPLRDDVIKRMRMYVLRSKVKLENVSDDFVRMGIAGPDAASLIGDITGIALEDKDAYLTTATFTVMRLPGIVPRFEFLASPMEARAIWEGLRQRAVPAGSGVWTWHDVMAGIPTVFPQTSDAFVPQTINLDLIDGISFNKGCYPGQEIVARVHYRGRLKERMFRARVDAAEMPHPGEPIYAPDLPGQATGNVVTAGPSLGGGFDLLAVIHLSSARTGALHLKQPDGPPLKIQSLPYQIPA